MSKHKTKNGRIWATLLLLVILGGVLSGATTLNYHMEKARCFQRLNSYVANISQVVAQDMQGDQAYLASIGRVLSRQDLTDYEAVGNFLNAMDGAKVVTRLELLLSGDLLLGDDGSLTDVSGQRSFAQEAERGSHICWQKGETEGSIILRQCVPIEQNGETAAVLCGIVDLTRIPNLFYAQEYGTEMQLYILERSSGQFLLDTWHDKLTTRTSLRGRKPARGYSLEQFDRDVAEGRVGTTVFQSSTTGEYFYTSYAPVEEADWMVMVTVPDRVVFAYAERLLRVFYALIAGMILIFLAYFFWTLRDVRRDRRARERELENIRYILDVEKNLFQAQTDPACFYSALEKIAEFLPAERAFFWAMDGYAPRQKRWWSSGTGESLERGAWFQTKFPGLLKQLQEQGSVICYHAVQPEEQALFQELHANSLMMIPVRKRDGSLTGILGAAGLTQSGERAEPLEQVAVSFSVTSEQYDAYRRLDRLSRMDTMTGLQNWNGFHHALHILESEQMNSFACVYVDANGLHEINNRLGHAAGDEMLVQIAEALNASFPDDGIYRVGGDEFVVLCRNRAEQEVRDRAGHAQQQIQQDCYEISFGVAWRDQDIKLPEIVRDAEQAMRASKQRYYESPERERYLRLLDEKTAQMFSRQQDMETFLSVLAPQFKGVYFVDLALDSIRYLFIPSYFKKILAEKDGKFSKGLLLYARQLARAEYYEAFAQLCDYGALRERLDHGDTPELIYQKNDGSWLQLRVIRTAAGQKQETLWIFTERP